MCIFGGDVLFKSSIYFQFVVTERCKKNNIMFGIFHQIFTNQQCVTAR